MRTVMIPAATNARTAPKSRWADGSWLKSERSSHPARSIMVRGPSEVPWGPAATIWSRAARHSTVIWMVPQFKTS